MKTIIVYYSFTRNNEKLAKYLQKLLNCDIVRVDTVKKRNGFSILLDLLFRRKPEIKPLPVYLKDYDHTILIAPIWAGRIAMPMKSFLLDQHLFFKQYSFITLCGGVAGQKAKIYNELVAATQNPPQSLLELWVNDLLPMEKRDSVKHTSGFRIDDDGLRKFEPRLWDFALRLSGDLESAQVGREQKTN